MTPPEPDLPTPPEEIPKYLAEPLTKQPPARLRTIAAYATELADAKATHEEASADDDEDDLDIEHDDVNDEMPDDVPKRATKTKKTINDNQYWYWQWREGDTIKSEYIEPVNPD